jgi:hypothetical protein
MINYKNFTDVVRFTKIYEGTKTSISKSHPWGVFAHQALDGISKDLQIFIKNKYEINTYDVSHCQGGPSMPRVPWVSITLSRTTVSKAPSYSICFGRKGEGFVHGLMLPATFNFHELTPVIRTLKPTYIDIDGAKNELFYNNRYINPQEVYIKDFNEKIFLKHLVDSLVLLKKAELKKD